MVSTRLCSRQKIPGNLSILVGGKLRDKRNKCRWSVKQVAGRLCLPEPSIKALEEGNLSFFTAEVYARGAYQRYANFLGLKQREDYHVFLQSLSQAREAVPLKLPARTTWQQRWLTPTVVLGVGIGMAVLMVAAYLGWQVRFFVALPKLSLSEPAGQLVDANEVWVKGQAEKEVLVTVNDIPVLLDEAAHFQMQLPLKPGINVVRVEAKGASGRVNVIEQHVLVPRL
jgi:cytoskeletal protein RodZ